jgi:predicted outer membrane repeat protein
VDDDQDGDGDPVATDCDDADASRASFYAEIFGNGIDDDCDPLTADDDQDGDGDPAATDCDDTDPTRSTLLAEIYHNGIDDDCDALTVDDDQDGDGDPAATDCDDADPARSTLLAELACDLVDNDCDGADLVTDGDADGSDCTADCDDADALVHPGLREVCLDGRDNNCNGTVDCLEVPADYATICAAAAVAIDGDVVHVAPGTYSNASGECFPLAIDEDVEFVGDDAATTVLDGEGLTDLLAFGAVRTWVERLTFTGGYGYDGIIANSGGAITLDGTIADIVGNQFTLNDAANGAAIQVTGTSDAVISDNVFDDNTDLYAVGGGAVFLEGGTLDFERNTADGNTAPALGCGLPSARVISGNTVTNGIASPGLACPATVEISDNDVEGNAGVGIDGGGPLVARNTVIGNLGGGIRTSADVVEDNIVQDNETPFGGAGLNLLGAGIVRNNQISGNLATGNGGGIAGVADLFTGNTVSGNTSLACGGGYAFDGTDVAVLDGETVSGNHADDVGGGLCALFGADATITGSTFDGNDSGYGGGIHVEDATLTLADSTILGNTVDLDYGGGLTVLFGASATVTNTRFEANSATYGGGIYLQEGTLAVVDSTFAANEGTDRGSAITNFNALSELAIDRSEFVDNWGAGSGVVWDESTMGTVITNSVFHGGAMDGWAGAMYLQNASGTLIAYNTFVDNTTGQFGAAVFFDGSSATFANNIVAHNDGDQAIVCSGGAVTLFDSDFFANPVGDQSGCALSSALFLDPGFVAFSLDDIAANDDLHLPCTSPLVDLGTAIGLPALDIDGDARPADGNLDGIDAGDVGADECN